MMLYFPQLATGSVACYPLAKTVVRRTVVNRMADGSVLKLADPDAASVQWSLRYSGLSDAEREALESFFTECEGRLHSFTFFDPTGNLLAHSDDLTESVWHVDGLVRIEEGLKLTNGGQSWQGIAQTVAGPEWMTWCFSASVGGAGTVRMSIGSLTSEYAVSSSGQTVWCSGLPEGDSEEITCRLDVAPGETVEISRLCLHAQPMPGEYRRTTQSSGVFTETRFDDDRLVFTADGPDNHSTTIRLMSRMRG
jgi:hypothetical protein